MGYVHVTGSLSKSSNPLTSQMRPPSDGGSKCWSGWRKERSWSASS